MNDANNNGKPITRLLALYSESNIHTGTGQSTGAIDLPIDRERHTGFPVMASSGLKGALREAGESKWPPTSNNGDKKIHPNVKTLFGPETSDSAGHAGALSVSQANLLAFPVRSLTNVFQWVTCPMVITRLSRDIELTDANNGKLPGIEVDESKGKAHKSNELTGSVILEDINISVGNNVDADTVIDSIAELLPNGLDSERFKKNCIIVSDDDFQYLVKYTTEVRARIKLNEQKTTTGGDGNLWYEETLPRDCLFYSLVRCMDSMDENKTMKANKVVEAFESLFADKSYLRVGGNETVGMGWCSVNVYPGGDKK